MTSDSLNYVFLINSPHLERKILTQEALCYIQVPLCSLRSMHATTFSIGNVMTFCLPKTNDRRESRFKPELALTLPPDGFNVIFSDDTPSKTDRTDDVYTASQKKPCHYTFVRNFD